MISQTGEGEIKIGKNTFKVKGTFYGIVEMESRACTGIGGLSYRLISKTVGLGDITSIIYGGIIGKCGEEKTPPITFEDLGEEITRHGFDKLVEFCTEFLSYAISGGKEIIPGKKKV